ncbi:MAG: isoprenyl transferase [Gammaproteobacteria bacterium]|jgi:undecaprenyl diphosphate synthase
MKKPNKNQTIPKHVAIVMDGNGRWAELHHKSRSAGHKAGGDVVQKVTKFAAENHIEVLSLFAFSTENWKRPQQEINYLMRLLLKGLQDATQKLHKNNIQLRFIGDLNRFSVKLRQRIEKAVKLTQNNTGLKLVIAINYGGQWDILQATKKISQKIVDREIAVKDICAETFAKYLTTADLPDPDLFIRTSGERRISNFFLWQLAYTELYFTDILWPDFNEHHFKQALDDFAKRKRRFGNIKAK